MHCHSCGSDFSLVDATGDTQDAPAITRLGRFELIERLGVGGFGTVWKARDKELDRTVAVKIPRQGALTAEDQEKFFREARAAAQLRHPNIVSVHEVGRDGDSLYIVSDFVRGVTLGDWLTGQKLTVREAAELAQQIAAALHHAHERGVIHRDLKPANILIDGDGRPHLMDFGLAKREVGEVTVTMDGQVLGTPAYMSPEQAQGDAHLADRRSDVYSLGVILFLLLTGELPFRGNARMLLHQVIHDEPPSPRKLNGNVPRDIETITLKCLEKNPARRYQSAQDLADELGRFVAGEPIRSRPIGVLARGWRWSKRHSAIASLMALLLVASLFSVWQLVVAHRARKLAEQHLAAETTARREAAEEARNADALNEILQQILYTANPEGATPAGYTVRDMLDAFADKIDAELHVAPEIEADIRATLGNAYVYRAILDRGEQQLQKALELRTKAFGTDHPDVARNLADLSFCHNENRELSAAVDYARDALAIHERLALRDRDTVRIHFVLQLALWGQGKLDEADRIGLEGIEIARGLAPPPPDLPSCIHMLAKTQTYRGNYDQAERLAREAVELHLAISGELHLESGWAFIYLGDALAGQHRFDEALTWYQRAFTTFRQLYDGSHHALSAAMYGITKLRAFDPAVARQSVALAIASKRYFAALTACGNAGMESTNDLIDAAVAENIDQLPPGFERVVVGELNLLAGDPDKAIRAIRSGLETGDPAWPFALKSLGIALLAAGQPAEAKQAFQDALAAQRQEDGSYDLSQADIVVKTAAYFLDVLSEEAYATSVEVTGPQGCFPWFYIGQRKEIEHDLPAAIAAYNRSVELGDRPDADHLVALSRWRLAQFQTPTPPDDAN
jgi:tetratricopeptide (TPR) repeat protein